MVLKEKNREKKANKKRKIKMQGIFPSTYHQDSVQYCCFVFLNINDPIKMQYYNQSVQNNNIFKQTCRNRGGMSARKTVK